MLEWLSGKWTNMLRLVANLIHKLNTNAMIIMSLQILMSVQKTLMIVTIMRCVSTLLDHFNVGAASLDFRVMEKFVQVRVYTKFRDLIVGSISRYQRVYS